MENSEAIVCPVCNQEVPFLNGVETGMKLALEMAGHKNVPKQTCQACYKTLKSNISEGAKLRADQQAVQQDLEATWGSRVEVVKLARESMKERTYADAIFNYEKYLSIVESTFGMSAGSLLPDKIDIPDKAKECTIITSVLWDLLQLYDMHTPYHDRLRETVKKLKLFLPYSNIYNQVIRGAAKYSKDAKRPDIFTELLRNSKAQKGACFVATAAFESQPNYPSFRLRQWRDESLKETKLGRRFIYSYYKHSPRLADLISKSRILKFITRSVLALFVRLLDATVTVSREVKESRKSQ